MSSSNFVTTLVNQLVNLIQPLSNAVQAGASGITQLGSELGYSLQPADATAISNALSSIADPLNSDAPASLDQLITEYASALSNPSEILNLMAGIRNIMSAISSLNTAVSSVTGLGDRLLEYLIVVYLENNYPGVYANLLLLGIITDTGQPATANSPEYTVNWDNFSLILRPDALASKVYGWNTSSFDGDLFLTNLGIASRAMGIPAFNWTDPNLANSPDVSSPSLFIGFDNGTVLLGAKFMALLASPPGGTNAGLAVVPVGAANITDSVDLGGGWSANVTVAASLQPNYGLLITPGGVSFAQIPGTSGGVAASFDATLGVQDAAPSGGYFTIFGDPSSTCLQAQTIEATLGVHPGKGEFDVELDFQGLQLIIDVSDDSFLSTILGSGQQTINLSCSMVWSSVSGFHFQGSVGAEIDIPVNATIAFIAIDDVAVGIHVSNSGLQVTVGATGSFTLGPVNASVENIGIELDLAPAPAGQAGLLGNLDLNFGFKPPDGVGIAVDADVVSGGGFLAYDQTKKEYSGALQLEAAGIGLAAYGFLDTVMPGGGSAYSLVLVINAQFGDPGLEIGFGVAITGIGGLVAINRTTDMNVVIADVKNGTIQNFLFNSDPVDNAPQIISGLAALFPAEQGEFVFGPMVQLQWGAGGFVTANIGVFLELTKAPKVIIAGSLSAGIPDPDADPPLIQLNVDVDGFIDFQAQELGFDAEIYNSYLAIFSISGGISLRAGWGANPIFLLSVGGFNPNFQPPAGYPTIPRIKVALCTSNDPTINLDGYLAVTSNTFQTGAQLYAYASVGNFWAQGDLGFDSLFIFNPFSFQIQIAASFSIGTGSSVILSASLSGSLSGPAPWIADGNVSFSFLFFHPSVGFHAVIGSAGQPQAASTAQQVEAALASALGSPANWSSNNVGGANSVVSINQPTPPNSNTIMMDPLGQLTVKQSAVPLNTTVTAYNNTPLESPVTITVSSATIEGQNAEPAYVPDDFAPASYETLPTDQQLSAPSFESLPGGVTVSPSYATASADTTNAPPTYVTTYIDDAVAGPIPSTFPYVPNPANFLVAVASGTAQQSALANSGPRKYASSRAATMSIAPDTYVLISTDGMKPTGMPAGATSLPWIQANAAKQSYLSANTTEDGYVQIVPATEVGAG